MSGVHAVILVQSTNHALRGENVLDRLKAAPGRNRQLDFGITQHS